MITLLLFSKMFWNALLGLISGVPRYSYITGSSAEPAALHAGVLGSLGTTMLLPNFGTVFPAAAFPGIAQGRRENLPLLLFPTYAEIA